ncbi:MAG: AAA family ATPase [Eggerthellaceae bacterium]|jgi:pilus assembly protein CpaE
MGTVVLCADEDSLRHPDLLGLEGEGLSRQDWLKPISHAEEARRFLRGDASVDEVWVASSDEMDAINLAAALKRDSADRSVYLVGISGNGSLLSRANSAGIDGVLDAEEFANRYAWRKRQQTSLRKEAVQHEELSDNLHAGAQPVQFKADSQLADCSNTKVLHRLDVWDTKGSSVRQRSGARVAIQNASGAYMLTVTSASGGTGKSTISVLLALISQTLGYRTLLFDADFQFGDVAQLLSIKDPLRIDQVLKDPLRVNQLESIGTMPAVLAPPLGPEDSEQMPAQLEGVIEKLRGGFDVIIVNTGSFWTEQHIKLIELSSNTLFLVDQRPTSLKAIKRALGLCARCGVAATPFLFAVNRCSKNAMLTSLDISCALNGARVSEFKDGGPEVEELMGAGMAGELLKMRNSLCVSLQSFFIEALPETMKSRAEIEREETPNRHLLPLRRRRRA